MSLDNLSEADITRLADAIWHADLERGLAENEQPEWAEFLSGTGSPAERSFAKGFLTLFPGASHGAHVFDFGAAPWVLVPQFKCERFRADFMLTPGAVVGMWRRMIIEIDGYKWHDTSPALARKDKERERRFLRYGIITARFAASEALRTPVACAAEAMRIAYEFNENQEPLSEEEAGMKTWLAQQQN